ncbi:MAG: TolC family protein [Bacteroidales bacterium]|nr:TolC family protein [Bacteroidales bacterium]
MRRYISIVAAMLVLMPQVAGAQYKQKEKVDPGGSNKVVDRTDRTVDLTGRAALENQGSQTGTRSEGSQGSQTSSPSDGSQGGQTGILNSGSLVGNIGTSGEETLVLTLEDALKIALSENVSVKVADKEVERAQYARKGTYASLFPQIDGSASYQRTIKKQVMYMDFDMGSLSGMAEGGEEQTGAALEMLNNPVTRASGQGSGNGRTAGGGIEVGRWNTFSTGVSASLPLVNAQLWKSLEVAGQDVELAVEKARSSRLAMVTQVKQAFYGVLLAKEALKVYQEVYDNALESFTQTERRFNVQKASELDYNRAKATVQNAIPQVYESANQVALALWQLKAILGMDLDTEIDVAGELPDWAGEMFYDIHSHDDVSLDDNTTMRQLAIQAEELANAVKLQQYASLPSLALSFNYSINAMTNDFNFSEYRWSPYSFVGLSLQVPIFAGGRRYHAVKQAQVQRDELQMQLRDTERQLKIAVGQYLSQMETKMKSYQAAQVAEETARKAYDIAAKSYQVGRSTITDLNSAQLALTQAQLAVSQAIYEFVLAKANLEETLGYDFTE